VSNAWWQRTRSYFAKAKKPQSVPTAKRTASKVPVPQAPKVSGAGVGTGGEGVWAFPHTRVKTEWQGGLILPVAIVLHHSGGSYLGGVDWIGNPAHNAKVSYHVLIAMDGRRTQFVDWVRRAWHAGKSTWQGRPDLNSWSIGISFEGDTYLRALKQAEIDSCCEVLRYLMKEFHIPKDRILSHRIVSPGRKDDPSPHAMDAILKAL